MTPAIETSTTLPGNPHVNGRSQFANGRLADETDSLYEIIDGKRVAKIVSLYANLMAGVLFARLDRYADETNCGRAIIETMFDLPSVGRVRRPDAAFITYQSWPKDHDVPMGDSWPIAPNLAVEVVSPTNQWDDVLAKVREYFSME